MLWQLCNAASSWPIGIACPADVVERYRSTSSSSTNRERSFLLAGLVRLAPALHAAELPTDVATDATKSQAPPLPPLPPALTAAVARFVAGPMPAVLCSAYAAAAALRPRQDDAARSAAERLLFELLQLHAATRGRFILNAPADFRFGPRPAEIDLLATSHRLAVEVDGYHHFTDADRYRRDRRKDLLLQQHGYVVVRVLADDVLDRPAETVDTIVAALDHAAGHANPGNL